LYIICVFNVARSATFRMLARISTLLRLLAIEGVCSREYKAVHYFAIQTHQPIRRAIYKFNTRLKKIKQVSLAIFECTDNDISRCP